MSKNPLTAGQEQQPAPDMNALYRQFQQNPTKYLTNLNIPQGLTDPEQIVRYLAQNGKIPPMLQGRVNAMLSGQKP